MKIAIQNPDLSEEERTYLTADYSSGTSLTVRNNEGITTNWFAVVGEPGQEQTETRKVTGTSGANTITITSALSFSHSQGTVVYLCQWDKWAFERKPSGGSYSEISGSPFAIEWDDEEKSTTIIVGAGLTTDTYRWRPYSSATGTYGTYSDELAGTGQERDTVGYVLDKVKLVPIAKEIKDETIISFFNDFQDLVYEVIPNAWWFCKEGTALATVASTYKYSITSNWSDFLSMKFMLFRYISGSNDITYPLSFSPTPEFYNHKADANQAKDDYVKKWSFLPPDNTSAKGYIGLHPTPKTTACYLKPVYFFELTDLDSFGDTLVIPKPKGYVDYALYRIYDEIKSDVNNANKYDARVKATLIALRSRARRQRGQLELFRFRGHRGYSQMFGEQARLDSSTLKELYW